MSENYNVGELRELLVQNGYDKGEVEKLSKKELKEKWEVIANAAKLLEGAEEVHGDLTTHNDPDKPGMGDPEWTDYVLGLLTDRELDNGNPKTDGLRRVAYKILGNFSSRTDVIRSPQNDSAATVVVSLEFDTGNSFGYQWLVQGAADVSVDNTPREYAVHAVASAETKAEGRALKKALKLVRVYAAEELSGGNGQSNDDKIHPSMVNNLQLMSRKQNIDLEKLAKKQFDVTDPKEMTVVQGRQLGQLLFEYSQQTKEIPNEIRA